jgi:hypothetical protein
MVVHFLFIWWLTGFLHTWLAGRGLQEMGDDRRSLEVELSHELDPEARELADLISQAPSVLSLGACTQPRQQHSRCPNISQLPN